MNKFYIITNYQKDEGLRLTKSIRDYLAANGRECIIQEESLKPQSKDYMFTDAGLIPSDVDCVMVLGGDGTLIQAARDIATKNIPLVGINLGTLGYLAEIEQNNIYPALDKLMADEYVLEKRLMLKGEMFQDGKSLFKNRALNDIVINRDGRLRILDYDIYVNDEYLVSYSADGMIISTPTGSTGYNLSAGGPIIDPKADILVVTPICAHTLNAKSIVLPASDKVVIKIGPGRKIDVEKVVATFDGDTSVKMETSDYIEITKSTKITQIIKLSNVSFLEALRNKMGDSK
ncbi:NAD(+)/NADH kinase [Konateibacter massiliensis]|uniref:NAD(+)/NADH kinase n=1 Tax=Konateibacter massiliensis TaxID=2002841 RepID=UPI000C159F98|nr:NAD(+)/NADH kinase [Konateibacter massiliensis]